MTPEAERGRRILLVAPNISRHMGGEGLKALQIHLELRALGHIVRQVTHARVRDEMMRDYPDLDIVYVEDDALQAWLHRHGIKLGLALLNAWQLHRCALRTARRFAPWVVHFTSPISPVQPYFAFPGQRRGDRPAQRQSAASARVPRSRAAWQGDRPARAAPVAICPRRAVSRQAARVDPGGGRRAYAARAALWRGRSRTT